MTHSPTPRSNPGVTHWSAEEDKTGGRRQSSSFPDWVTTQAPRHYSVNPTIRRVKWTVEEDGMLRQGVAQHGAKEWARWVPGHMNGRTAPQCRGGSTRSTLTKEQ